jgi:hypothetical protein
MIQVSEAQAYKPLIGAGPPVDGHQSSTESPDRGVARTHSCRGDSVLTTRVCVSGRSRGAAPFAGTVVLLFSLLPVIANGGGGAFGIDHEPSKSHASGVFNRNAQIGLEYGSS